MADVPQLLLTLLSSNWNSANTGSVTPTFLKVTDKKRINFNETKDFIIAQRNRTLQKPAGIGGVSKHVEENINLDIRTMGFDQESHFLDVLAEVIRILDANLTSPVTGFDELVPDGFDQQDLSDGRTGLWRKIVPVRLINYNEARV